MKFVHTKFHSINAKYLNNGNIIRIIMYFFCGNRNSIEGSGIRRKKGIRLSYKIDSNFITIYSQYEYHNGTLICSSERSYKLPGPGPFKDQPKTVINVIGIPPYTGIVSCGLYGEYDHSGEKLRFKIKYKYSTIKRGLFFDSKKRDAEFSSYIHL